MRTAVRMTDVPREFVTRLRDPQTDRVVVIEDDGQIALAFLFAGGRIVSDVSWISAEHPPPLTSDRAIRCCWDALGVDVLVDDQWWARLESGACPGWSRLAVVDGPLARAAR